MDSQRREALSRGAEQKALEIDPFSADGLDSRLRELGVKTFGGCSAAPEGFRDLPSMARYRLLAAADYRAREPTFRKGGPSQGTEVRAAIVPVVMISCLVEIEARPVAAGGFIATVDRLEFTALFDRELSWWNPERAGDEVARLHGQLHFDVAHLLAKEANRGGAKVLRGSGMTERAARDQLQIRLSNRIGDLERELRRITDHLDLATSKGWDATATRLWEDRVRHGLDSVRQHLPEETF